MSASLQATLRYLADRDDKAVYHASAAGGPAAKHEGVFRDEILPVHDGRNQAFTLAQHGFQLVSMPSRVSDFYDDEQIFAIYEAEVVALVKAATGARDVRIFDHTRRSASADHRAQKITREPASIIHNDYSEESGRTRLFDLYPEEAEQLMMGRIGIVNIWRTIAGEVETYPLAFCDANSVAPEDFITVTRQAENRVGALQMAVYNPNHRWYYFPKMRPDEAALISTWDNDPENHARFTLHTAFDNPDAPDDAPPRESMETRCFVFYG